MTMYAMCFFTQFPHQNPLHTSPLSKIVLWSIHQSIFNLIPSVLFGVGYKSWMSSLCSLVLDPCYLVPLGLHCILIRKQWHTCSVFVYFDDHRYRVFKNRVWKGTGCSRTGYGKVQGVPEQDMERYSCSRTGYGKVQVVTEQGMDRYRVFQNRVWKGTGCYRTGYGKVQGVPEQGMERYRMFQNRVWKGTGCSRTGYG